ncbi:hypothetical protein Ndes2526B_g02948 [Nannochloris sp. 'desiccata']|nr:hypothetical protein KSW81_006802 [Chlorella desiccata (nom. nud.)]KAH7622121.1 putative EEF1A lysine methyltransferase 1 [Chlorella desiccata (nom. nud.)]
MEQIKATRGPYETLHDDPAALRSPEATPAQTYIDLQMNIKLMKSSDLPEAEDIVSVVESIDEATVHLIADEASYAAGASGRVACIACPGVYVTLKEAHPDHKSDLFIDFDPRFRGFGKDTLIIPLDGDQPLDAIEHLPSHFHHAFKVVVVDTTFLDFLPLERILDISRLLGSLHEPLKLILIAPETAKEKAAVLGLHMAKVRPHGRHGATARVYTTISNPRKLH